MAASKPKTIARNCEQCGEEFQVRPIIVAGGNGKYCGKPCFYAARAAKRPVLTCPQCGKDFDIRVADLGIRKYCSRTCQGLGHSADRRPLEERFWEKVDKGDGSGCWIWTGCKAPKGYGHIGTGGREGKDVIVTRLIWEWTHGPIPDGMFVRHDCPGGQDNPSCVNPDHLFLGTPQDNTDDMVAKDRHAKGEAMTGSKLTTAQVVEMKRMYRAGEANQGMLSERFSVSRPTVSEIVNGKKWKHIP